MFSCCSEHLDHKSNDLHKRFYTPVSYCLTSVCTVVGTITVLTDHILTLYLTVFTCTYSTSVPACQDAWLRVQRQRWHTPIGNVVVLWHCIARVSPVQVLRLRRQWQSVCQQRWLLGRMFNARFVPSTKNLLSMYLMFHCAESDVSHWSNTVKYLNETSSGNLFTENSFKI